MSKFYESLAKATDERSEVQPLYREEIIDKLKENGNFDITKGIVVKNTDGMIPAQYFKDGVLHPFVIILECKLEQSFTDLVYRSGVILQVICYLKQQKEKGNELPRVAVIGSKKNCFTLPVSVLQSYISLDIKDYTKASEAYKTNSDLVKQIARDQEINKYCYLYEITDDFNMRVIVDNLLKLAQDLPLTMDLDEKSISRVFDYFSMYVLKEREKGYKGEKVALDGRIQKDLFMTMLLKPQECYLHPNKVDTAIFGEGNLRAVNSGAYIAFKNSYRFNGYGLDDEKKFTEICDRLIEDADRRKRGDFYTGSIWVDEAHKLLTENLGEDWKDDYIVWDNSAGTKNLTRDYKFNRLYSSTLEAGDLKIGERYNRGNVAFQYDFLNDDVELFEELRVKKESGQALIEQDFEKSKLYFSAPGLVRGMLEGKKLLFFMNPPYGTANNSTKVSGKIAKSGIATSLIQSVMKRRGLGAATQQLYAQFIFRCKEIMLLFDNNSVLALYSTPLFLTGPSYNKFRKDLTSVWNLQDGMLFNAHHFADVSDTWGISFTIFNTNQEKKDKLMLKDVSVDGMVVDIDYKHIYNIEQRNQLSNWIREPIKHYKTEDAPQMKSALNYISKPHQGNLVKGAYGYLVFGGNNIQENTSGVFLLSSCRSSGHGLSIMKENFDRCCVAFSARKLIKSEWYNSKDEYIKPNVEDFEYKRFEADSIVYSIFNTSSNQSSLRDIFYNDKSWDIYNHFFFMSREEIQELASGKLNQADLNREIEDDLDMHGLEERFVYKKLQEVELSTDAQAVLDKAKELVRLSFKDRELFNMQYPEYHINTWDAGFYQLKGLLKEYHPEELKEFNKLYKEFEDRMRPLVYLLGFLKS